MIKYLFIFFILANISSANDNITELMTNKIKENLIENDLAIYNLTENDIDIKFDKKSELLSNKFIDIESVKLVKIDKIKKSFIIKINFVDDAKNIYDRSIHGIYDLYIMLPMLRHTISKGEIIEESDIEEIKTPLERIKKSIIKNQNDLIGKTPKNLIQSYKMINVNDLNEPNIVNKGDQININYRNNNLVIRMSAIAMESGSKGSIIRVKNPKTNNTISAIIEDGNNVKSIN